MLKADVQKHFKTNVAIAKALGITKVSVGDWDEIIPELRARQLAEVTKGKLRFRSELYTRRSA